MNRQVEKYRVVILDEEYFIASDEPEEHVVVTANYVHTLLQDVIRKNPLVAQKKIAILVALQLASKLINNDELAKKRTEKHDELIHSIDGVLLNTAGR